MAILKSSDLTSGLLRRATVIAAAVTVASLLLAAAAWLIAPFCVGDAIAELAVETPVRCFYDRSGELYAWEPTFDHVWRFDVPLSAVSAAAVSTLLAVEDAGFYRHGGVDYGALLRAVWQNLRHLSKVSGASTVTMQLAGLAEAGVRRGIAAKFRQMARARKLERLYSKERILTEYLNRIPFGGKIYGIEAAALYYFGCHASELDSARASLLCGIPQRPNGYRPDRHLTAALRRRRRALHMLERRALIAPGEAKRLAGRPPVLRDFSQPSILRRRQPRPDDFALAAARREAGGETTVHLSIDGELQSKVAAQLRLGRAGLFAVRDGAAVVIDNRRCEVLALVGTLDYFSPLAGMVDAAAARRGAGSTLKPFIYAEAVAGGLLSADTLLLDAPVDFAGYRPGNYDGVYRGEVDAATALATSLNTPAVRLLAALGARRVVDRFIELGLLDSASDSAETVERNGLALAFGTAGHTLLSLTAAYAALARGGVWMPPEFLHSEAPRSGRRIWPEGAARQVNFMLKRLPLPGSPLRAAWKTGTSNGNRDAWCFAYTPDFTVGVWFGNKTGDASPALVGVEAALPTAAELVRLCCRGRRESPWGSEFRPETLCIESGLRAGAACRETRSGIAAPDIPLRRCEVCGIRRFAGRQGGGASKIVIASPVPGEYAAGGDGSAKITLAANPPAARWYVDGVLLPGAGRHVCRLVPGRHRVAAVAGDGAASDAVEFSVTVGGLKKHTGSSILKK